MWFVMFLFARTRARQIGHITFAATKPRRPLVTAVHGFNPGWPQLQEDGVPSYMV